MFLQEIRWIGVPEMNYPRYVSCILILVLFAVSSVVSDDSLNNPGQDAKGSATPVITGKNTPVSTVNTGSSEPKTRLLNPMSKWHLDLQDSKDRSVELEVCQSNNVVFGKGTIATDDLSQNVTATGTFSGNKLNLDIFSEDMTLFRLFLTISRKSFAGDYNAYSASYVPWKGIAMGSIN